MTPAEVFEKLGFSPIMQAIAGLLWFATVLFVMVRAESAKRSALLSSNGKPPTVPPSAIPVPDHLAKIADLCLQNLEVQRQVCAKINGVHTGLTVITERLTAIAVAREGQIDELITAIKESCNESKARRWW